MRSFDRPQRRDVPFLLDDTKDLWRTWFKQIYVGLPAN